MSFAKFCPRCGKDTNSFIGNICTDCFLQDKKIFEVGKISIFVCKFCNRLFISNNEVAFSEEVIGEEVASKTTVIPELGEPKIFVELIKRTDLDYEAIVNVKGLINDTLVEQTKIVHFQLKETRCDACMKLNSDYREAILQLRSVSGKNKDELMRIAEEVLKKENVKNPLSGTSKIIEMKNGYDLWIGSKKAAVKVSRYLSKLYKVKLIVSKKLIGEEKSGQRKYRFTFCVKID
jgi:NMD protein affecting ribosome stability and mRNA decay